MTDSELQEFVTAAFERNYELLRMEGGHALAPDVKQSALLQVLLYWRKLRSVAENVTDTEVKLNLPGQTTPKGRKFGIDGVVDIVRENDQTIMYDIKTHDIDVVRAYRDIYEPQLNLYAHIWQNLRGQPLNGAAIIATAFPDSVREALATNNSDRIETELKKWNPLLEISIDNKDVDQTVREFACVVDKIEENKFSASELSVLKSKLGDNQTLFATRVCRNCDARFSCESYREYALGSSGRAEAQFRRYFTDVTTDMDREQWLTASLQSTVNESALD